MVKFHFWAKLLYKKYSRLCLVSVLLCYIHLFFKWGKSYKYFKTRCVSVINILKSASSYLSWSSSLLLNVQILFCRYGIGICLHIKSTSSIAVFLSNYFSSGPQCLSLLNMQISFFQTAQYQLSSSASLITSPILPSCLKNLSTSRSLFNKMHARKRYSFYDVYWFL